MTDKNKEVNSFILIPRYKLPKITKLLSYVFIDFLKLECFDLKSLVSSLILIQTTVGSPYSYEGSLRCQESSQGDRESKDATKNLRAKEGKLSL